jgi:CheY-like chemotaxis protein
MNIGPNHPSGRGGHPGGGRGKRRRGRRGQGAHPGQHGPHPAHKGHGSKRQNPHAGIYTAPMDHSYRALQGDNGAHLGNRQRGRGGRPFPQAFPQPEPEPLPHREDATARIFVFVEDLFFLAKIQETARKLNVKVEFVKNEKDILDRIGQNGEEKPSLIIFDLNNAAAKPLSVIPRLKSRLKKETAIIGFLSHVQGDLKLKAQEAGCDMVLPRSAFSQNLPQLLRRHGAAGELQAGLE